MPPAASTPSSASGDSDADARQSASEPRVAERNSLHDDDSHHSSSSSSSSSSSTGQFDDDDDDYDDAVEKDSDGSNDSDVSGDDDGDQVGAKEEAATSVDADHNSDASSSSSSSNAEGDTGSHAKDSDYGAVVVDEAECARLKTAGNEAFAKGDMAEALQMYNAALRVARHKPRAPPPPPPSTHRDRHGNSADGGGGGGGDAGGDAVAVAPAEDDTPDYTLTAQIFCNAAYCLMRSNDHDKAVDLLNEAIRHNARYAKAYLRRADCYGVTQKWSSANADYDAYEKLVGSVDAAIRARAAHAKAKSDEEMKKMLSELKDVGNRLLGTFGLSTDNFKFVKDPVTGSYSMSFER